ncbi:MAG: peptidoglycan-binding domain-containing protein [Minisyncoccia bacterium]
MSISVSLSKVSAAVAGLVLAFALATTASAQTTSCYTFTLNHKLGNTGGEVMWIQKFLNMNAATQVAASGAGSTGQETTRMGGLTKAAVMKFQAANAISPVSGYWGPLTRAKANALEAARCAGGTTGGTTTPATGDAVLAAAAQPGNSLAVASAARVPFTKFTVTAGANPVTLNSVTVERGGLAADGAFTGIILLDDMGNQLGIEKVLNSNHQATIGSPVVIPAGMTKTFTVAANMAAYGSAAINGAAGQVAVFSVVSANTSGTVAGSLPITGAQHTVNASLQLGSVVAARGVLDPISAQTKEIGTTGYKFSSVRLTAGSAEKVRVWGIRFNQSGSASSSDLSNVKVWVDGTEYPTTVTTDGKYYDSNFGSGIVIDKGLSKDITISADITSGSGRTVAFDLYKITDVKVTGETYGYGITPTGSAPIVALNTPAYVAPIVSISAGTFNSVAKSNAAAAANVAKVKANEILGAFTVDVKGESIQVQSLKFDVTGNFGGAKTITNVSLVDQTGAVIAGPVDSVDQVSPLGDFTFSSATFKTGVTTVYVKGQLSSTWANGDTLIVATNPSTQWSGVTGETSGRSITLPVSLATANTMTVKNAAVVVKTLPTPAAKSVVKGSTKVQYATLALDAANSGDDVRVSNITLTNTVGGAALVSEVQNVELWADLTSAMDTTRNDKYETRLVSAKQFTGATLAIPLDTQVTVAKNASVEVAVLADLTANATTGTHAVSASAATATALTSGETVTPTFSATPQTMTVATNGTLAVELDNGNAANTSTILKDDVVVEQFLTGIKLTANNVEDIKIEEVQITTSGTGNLNAMSKYVLYKGATKLGEALGGSTTATFFLADGALVVPANNNVALTIKGVANNIDGVSLANGATIGADVAAAGHVKARSSASGTIITPTLTAMTEPLHSLYEVVPVFVSTTVSNTALTPNAQYLAAKFTITANGDKDVTFTNAATNQIVMKMQSAGFTAPTVATVRDASTGNSLGTTAIAGGAFTVNFSANPLTISAGTSKTIDVYIDTSSSDGSTGGSDSLYVFLDDNAATNLEYGVNGTGDNAVANIVFKNDIYGSTHTRN